MPNDVFRAIDAMLVLGVDDTSSPEGAAADSLVAQYDLSNAVGRLRNVTISVTNDLAPFYEIGRRYPTHLRPGVIHVSGTAERAHVNGALLRLLLGDGAVSPPAAANFVQPAFNIIATLVDPARPDQNTKVTIFGAKFESWNYNIPSEDFVMESVSFQAIRLSFEES
ncbi:hypothetical protein EH223_19335 [candidate division KSB1 bacterium]|nr:hypothetical protein [candidate division KSB1 bacterium]RQW00102.1 MAG: hypothetical protein EH223_19335 [candidate division KSB1 bacterium]